MLGPVQEPLHRLFLRLEGWGEYVFGRANNPFVHLGSLGWWTYWLVAGTGIYLYIFFETDIAVAYLSVEAITHEQWYLGGVMRSLHRYGSDAMVVLVGLHIVREFAFGRYNGMRWFSWISGVPTIWLLAFAGIGGYWLVWDEMAQYLAVGSMEWIDWIGIFSEPIANNFLTRGALSGRFFSLLVFIHIFAPLFLLFLMWIHLLRVSRAETSPPRRLGLWFFGVLLLLSLAQPAVSHGPADLGRVVGEINPDWFYMAFYPLFDRWGPGVMWGLAISATLFLAALPWMRRAPKVITAEVVLPHCNGCALCQADCPFGAISLVPRSDGLPFEREVAVNPDLCTGCGICNGACPTTMAFRTKGDMECGIELPDMRLVQQQAAVDQALAKGRSLIVFGCKHGVDLKPLASKKVGTVTLPCIGMLSPSFIDYAFSKGGAEKVLLTGCRPGECFHRLGIQWTEERLAGKREPALRDRVPKERLFTFWAAPYETEKLKGKIGELLG